VAAVADDEQQLSQGIRCLLGSWRCRGALLQLANDLSNFLWLERSRSAPLQLVAAAMPVRVPAMLLLF